MRTIILDENRQLVVGTADKPQLKAGELLIEVHATAVNRTDLLNVERAVQGGTEPLIGVEVAGVVADTQGETDLKVGDRVMGLVSGGGYSEYAAMPVGNAMRIPDNLSFEEAAAIPEVFSTAYKCLFWHGELAEGERVLIHAGGSGVGTAAIQLAKALRQAEIFVTAGSPEKLNVCRELGADVTVNYKEEGFSQEVLKATHDQGVDVIMDFIGASYWKKNYRSIAQNGRWVLIGTLGGSVVEKMNIFSLMHKFITLKGTLLTPRSDEYKAALTACLKKDVLPLFAKGDVRPIVDTSFALADAQAAHEYMLANKNIGKIILNVK